MAANIIIIGGQTILDLSDSTVTASDLRDGVTAYDKAGNKLIGSLDQNVTVTNFSGSVSPISGDDCRPTISS